MKRKKATPRLYLAASGVEDMPVANAEERLLALLATLEECQAFLTDRASTETARLLSLAILELRMELRGGPGCLNRFSASISGASAEVRLPSGVAAG